MISKISFGIPNYTGFKRNSNKNVNFGQREKQGIKITIGGAALASLLMAAGLGSCTKVEPGHVGIVDRFGDVKTALQPGLHLKAPFIDGVKKVDIRTQTLNGTTKAYTEDAQEATVTFSVDCRIKSDDVLNMYKEHGIDDFAMRFVGPKLKDAVESVFSQYSSDELLQNRNKPSPEITKALNERLEKFYIEVLAFNCADVDFSDNFDRANEAKVIAKQEVITAEHKAKKAEQEAKEAVTKAQGEADAALAKAKAEAEARKAMGDAEAAVLKAKGDAEAAAIKAKGEAEISVMTKKGELVKDNPGLVENERIRQWDGHYPETMVTTDGSATLLNLKMPSAKK